ncbi:MAG TPA: HlyD family efflux transporter periplasmic adaptor subunit [Phycisphaerae bacterium]|nr:HlyD family efflux transporter periplasmic adaptor subunit [Phycisphaerae bacterium]HRY70891.1 HlyD family efflux transporter periplasmic adaptor subunit [Phycisphaerae bacterium]HSA29415.1 HlyD family efflux transporter periplasmic adaptor subunit [Phycisphaerae bacterium]
MKMELDTTMPVTPLRGSDKLLPGPGILISRGLVYLALALVATALMWMWLAQADVVVNARGRLIIKGEPLHISAPEFALVVDVLVRIGQHVSEGDVLLRLDAFQHTSEADRLSAEIATLRLETSRHRANADALAQVRRALETERDTAKRSAGLVAEQLERLRTLEQGSAATHMEVQAKQRELLDVESRLARLDADLKRNLVDATERGRLALEAEARVETLTIQLGQLREYARRSVIRAPVAGTVTHLAVLHPGSAIDTSRPAVTVMPDDQPLMACIAIPNASMRRLHSGLPVRLAFDALPREDYGYVEGRLVEVEPDAGEEGYYRAWVSLERQEQASAPLLRQIKPGLMMEARILVERRSILDLLLKPLKRLGEPASISA